MYIHRRVNVVVFSFLFFFLFRPPTITLCKNALHVRFLHRVRHGKRDVFEMAVIDQVEGVEAWVGGN